MKTVKPTTVINEEQYSKKLQECLQELETLVEQCAAPSGNNKTSAKDKAADQLGIDEITNKLEERWIREKASELKTSTKKTARASAKELSKKATKIYNK